MSDPEKPVAPLAADPSDSTKAEADPAQAAGESVPDSDAPPAEAADADLEDEEFDGEVDDFGPPFVPKTFGGAFVWAKGEGFITTVLRIKEGKSVPVSTQNRHDMHVMLTGGRAVLEVDDGEEVDRVELVPAGPLAIDPANRYRLIAMTEVEIFTVYSQG